MAVNWYYAVAGEKRGPVTSTMLKQMAEMGDLQPDTLVWKDGLPEWVHARKIKGLFPENAPPLPPPVAPPGPEHKVRIEPDVSVRVSRPRIGGLASTAKWVAIVWSVICLLGVIVGLANVGSNSSPAYTEAERAGQVAGIGCGMFIWVFFWAAIALPALVIWLVAQKR